MNAQKLSSSGILAILILSILTAIPIVENKNVQVAHAVTPFTSDAFRPTPLVTPSFTTTTTWYDYRFTAIHSLTISKASIFISSVAGSSAGLNLSLHADNGLGTHLPTGNHLCQGLAKAKAGYAIVSSGAAANQIAMAGTGCALTAGTIYHIEISSNNATATNKFFIQYTAPQNPIWINGTSNGNRGTLTSSNSGGTWSSTTPLGEPVYSFLFTNNEVEGNGYSSGPTDTDHVYGTFGGLSEKQGFTFYVTSAMLPLTIDKVSLVIGKTGSPPDNLSGHIAKVTTAGPYTNGETLAIGKALLNFTMATTTQGVAAQNQGANGGNYGDPNNGFPPWTNSTFPAFTFPSAGLFMFYLDSPGSTSSNFWDILQSDNRGAEMSSGAAYFDGRLGYMGDQNSTFIATSHSRSTIQTEFGVDIPFIFSNVVSSPINVIQSATGNCVVSASPTKCNLAYGSNVRLASLLTISLAFNATSTTSVTLAVNDTRLSTFTVTTPNCITDGGSRSFCTAVAYGEAPTAGADTISVKETGSTTGTMYLISTEVSTFGSSYTDVRGTGSCTSACTTSAALSGALTYSATTYYALGVVLSETKACSSVSTACFAIGTSHYRIRAGAIQFQSAVASTTYAVEDSTTQPSTTTVPITTAPLFKTNGGWAETGLVISGVTTVTEQVTLTISPGGSPNQGNVAISGCSPSIGTIPIDGAQHTFTANPSCSLTYTVAADSANARDRFSPLSSTWIYTTAASGTETKSNTVYHQGQMQASYSVSGGGSPTAPTLSFTSLGGAATYTVTTTPTGVWLDHGTAWSTNDPLGGSGSSERWEALSGTSGAESDGGTINPTYYHQFSVSIFYSVTYGGSPTAPTLSFTAFGSPATYTMTTSPTINWLDTGTSCSSNTPIAGGAGERWDDLSVVCTNSAGGVYSPIYYHQFQISFATTPSGVGTTNPTGSNIWEYATNSSISASSNSNGYNFNNWIASAGITVGHSKLSSTTAIFGATGTLTANFTAVSSSGGSGCINCGIVGTTTTTLSNSTVIQQGTSAGGPLLDIGTAMVIVVLLVVLLLVTVILASNKKVRTRGQKIERRFNNARR